MQKYVLGIDGGGTKTICLLANESGVPIGRGIGGPSNPNIANPDEVEISLSQAIAGAVKPASLSCSMITAVYAGIAGAGEEEKQNFLRNKILHIINTLKTDGNINEIFATQVHIEVNTDAVISLVAGTKKRYGVVAISGTGAIVYGETGDGRKARAGGWGNLFDNEGSGYVIGKMALQTILKSFDGRGPQTIIGRLILKEWNFNSSAELIRHILRKTPSVIDIAKLAQIVNIAARNEDTVALQILKHTGNELFSSVQAVTRELGLMKEKFPFVLTGGVLNNITLVKKHLIHKVNRHIPSAIPVNFTGDAARGAIILALENTARLPAIPLE